MARVLRNIFLILFASILTANFIVITISYTSGAWIDFDLKEVFEPSRSNFLGFNHWFNKIKDYPGLYNLTEYIRNTANLVGTASKFESLPDGIIALVQIIATPFLVLGLLIIDILSNIIWFLNLLDPYHNFGGIQVI